jgi:hypothetical protein
MEMPSAQPYIKQRLETRCNMTNNEGSRIAVAKNRTLNYFEISWYPVHIFKKLKQDSLPTTRTEKKDFKA